jgi:hypothetical protein
VPPYSFGGMASVNGATCAMCIEKSLDSLELLLSSSPGDYRQRRNREKFQIVDGT